MRRGRSAWSAAPPPTGPGAIALRLASDTTVAPVPVTNEIVGFLIDLHWLAEAESENRERISDAISRLLVDASAAFARSRDR